MKRKNDATSSTSNDINEKLINLCKSDPTNTEVLNEISDLLSEGADVNHVGQNGGTALILASRNGHKDTVEFLLNKEADVNQTNQDGNTALMLASYTGHKETVEFLLDKEALVNQTNQDGDTALILASQNGHKDIVEVLFDGGAGVNQVGHNGVTALFLASQNGHKDTVEFLLDKRADVNQSNQNGVTALMMASHNGHDAIVQFLLKKGANAELSQCASQASKNSKLIQHISEEEKYRKQEGDIIAQRTDSTFQNVKKFLEQEFNDEGFLCPISFAIMKSPYSCLTHEESSRTLRGVAIVSEEIMQNYEKDTIIKHIETTVVTTPRDPLTNKKIKTIFPNTYLRQEMIKYFSTEYPPVIQSLNNEGHYHSARKLAVDVLDKDFPITPEVRQQIVTELLPSIVDNISNKQISGEKRHHEPSESDENKLKEPKIVPSTNISPQESQRADSGSTLSQTQQGS